MFEWADSLLFVLGLVITEDLLFPLHSSANIAAMSGHISDKMTSPRHSPRLAGEDAHYLHDILLTCGMKNNSACGKIVTIHDVRNTISLKDLQKKYEIKSQIVQYELDCFGCQSVVNKEEHWKLKEISVRQKTNIRMQMGK